VKETYASKPKGTIEPTNNKRKEGEKGIWKTALVEKSILGWDVWRHLEWRGRRSWIVRTRGQRLKATHGTLKSLGGKKGDWSVRKLFEGRVNDSENGR